MHQHQPPPAWLARQTLRFEVQGFARVVLALPVLLPARLRLPLPSPHDQQKILQCS